MKTLITPLIGLCLLAGLSAMAENSDSKPETLKAFTTADHTISKDVVVTDDKAWLIESKKAQTVRFFELPDPGVEDCVVIYRAKLKTKDLKEPAYLEMWCRV